MTAPIVFLDTETTGTGHQDEIWELGAVRRDPDGTEIEQLLLQVHHDVTMVPLLPAEFRVSWAQRYDIGTALSQPRAVLAIADFFMPNEDFDFGEGWSNQHPAIVVGANPRFDMDMITRLINAAAEDDDFAADLVGRDTLWHYRPVDVGALAYGYLAAQAAAGMATAEVFDLLEAGLPWSSDAVSRAVGVDPDQFARHTAMGDVRWCMAIYDRVIGRVVRDEP